MLALRHIEWNLPPRDDAETTRYFSDVFAFASRLDFSVRENVYTKCICDACACPIPIQHLYLVNSETRWCFECLEHEYRQKDEQPLPRPASLDKFRDHGQEY